MPLPKIQVPVHQIPLPSNGKKISVRQMTIKEEKMLMVAKESESENEKQEAIIQVVNSCIMEDGFDINSIAMFDLEFLFMRLRALSVSNVVDVQIPEIDILDGEPQVVKMHDKKIDLAEVIVKTYDAKEEDRMIKYGDIVIELQYPTLAMYRSPEYLEAEGEADITGIVIKHSIKQVFEGDKAYTAFTQEELEEFTTSLPSEVLTSIVEFFEKQPHLFYEAEYTKGDGTKEKSEFRSLYDFFTF